MDGIPVGKMHADAQARREAAAGGIIEYLIWRGDVPFTREAPGDVDALIFSALSYIRFDGIVPGDALQPVTLRDAAARLLAQSDLDKRLRVEKDRELLLLSATSRRFGQVKLCRYRSVFIPEEETQFAAVTFLLEDGSAFLAFRGTDKTVVGWKEDFNMMFQDCIPAQRLAYAYAAQYALLADERFSLCGHSKGGNLAVYAAARCTPDVQDMIGAVYNHDGPGFTDNMLNDPGYLRIVPKIRSFVPQSSVVGMLLERRETCTIVRCRKLSVMQHDPYTWHVVGSDFVAEEERTLDSRFLDRTVSAWLAGMSREERSELVDAVFGGVKPEEGATVRDLLTVKNIRNYLAKLYADDDRRRKILLEMQKLAVAAKNGLENEVK